MATKDLTGMQFGRWTALERTPGPGAARWRCRCSCGVERDVAARNLIAGKSASCGCLTRERAREALSTDLCGRRFGKLLVLERAERRPDGAQLWRCRCDCGKECEVLHSSLHNAKRTSCGCDSLKGKHTARDLAGQKFDMLTALYPTENRHRNGSVVWHCRCDCGNEADVSLDRLKFGGVISCGCMREKSRREIPEKLTHVAGTSIDALRSRKIRSDNRTGVRGVYMKRGRFCALITFQQKDYYLGSYPTVEAAAMIRREAEKLLHEDTVNFYGRWKQRADEDPEWAEKNPSTFA